MNKIDKKILKELLRNSRITLSKLGKKVRLSRENVYYRIQSLLKQKVINEFVTEINYKALGFFHNVVFLQFDKITDEKEKQILDYLEENSQANWVGPLTGKWSLCFDVYSKGQKDLNDFITSFLTKFKENIGEYLVLDVSEAEYFFNKIIDQPLINMGKEDKAIENFKIDKINLNILKKLNANPRATYIEISNGLKLTPNAMKQRIKQLEKNKIILGYSISINYKALGFEWQGFQIKLTKPNKEIEKRIKEYFRTNKKITFFYQYTKSGVYDFDIGVIVKNSSELRDFINDLRSKFYDEIKIYDTFLILEETSSYKLPKIIFE